MLYFKYFKNEHFSDIQLYGNLFLIFFKNNVKSLEVRCFVKSKPKSDISPVILTPPPRVPSSEPYPSGKAPMT